MDTTETNIKMCEKAAEIQVIKRLLCGGRSIPWLEGDIIALDDKVFMYNGCDHSEGFIEPEVYDPACIWLPRQDQLQEMVDEPLWQLNFKFIAWLCDEPYDGHIKHSHLNLNSMEQLWLAFVMKEKYGKVWDGQEWKITGGE